MYRRYSAKSAPARDPNANDPKISHVTPANTLTSGCRTKDDADEFHDEGERENQDEVREDHDRERQLRERARRSRLRDDRDRDGGGEARDECGSRPAAAMRCRPLKAGAMCSHGHADQSTMKMNVYVRRIVTPPIRAMTPSLGASRRRFISSPATNAINVTARPLTICSSRAIGRVMMLATYRPAEEAEQQIAGHARQPDFLGEPSDERRRDERDSDGERCRAKRGFGRSRFSPVPRRAPAQEAERPRAPSGGLRWGDDRRQDFEHQCAGHDGRDDGAAVRWRDLLQVQRDVMPMTPGETRTRRALLPRGPARDAPRPLPR